MPQAIVDDVAIEVELARVFGLERPRLQVDDHERTQTKVVEQEVDVVVFVSDIQPILPTNESEALTEFDEELFQMVNETGFKFAFVKGFFQRQEVEDVGVFERLLRQVGLRSREELVEVRNQLALGVGGRPCRSSAPAYSDSIRFPTWPAYTKDGRIRP